MTESIEVRMAKAFLAHRKRLAEYFGQVVAVPDWDELPELLRLLSIAAMREALYEEVFPDYERIGTTGITAGA